MVLTFDSVDEIQNKVNIFKSKMVSIIMSIWHSNYNGLMSWQVLESMVKLMKDCWKQNAPARLSSLRVKKNLSKLMEMVKPAPSNTALSEEYGAIISDVNIHIPETCSENQATLKV